MSAEKVELVVTLRQEKVTKGTVVFVQTSPGTRVTRTLYVDKEAIAELGNPTEIEVVIRATVHGRPR